MTKLLIKWFVPQGLDEASARGSVGTLSGSVGIGANLLLFLGKLLAGLLSSSVSMVADALNNLSDASGAILTLIGFRLAGKPADAHHPYGYARFEYLSGLAVSAMILLMGVELGRTAAEKMIHPTPVGLSVLTAVVLLVSIAVKLWLYRFNRTLGQHIGSAALLATAADSRNDCIATAGVLAAALVEHWLDLRVDGLVGLGVAVFILKSGWSLARQTISPLLGEGVGPELRQTIVDYVRAQPRVLGYHDLMVHDYGPGRQYASLHVEMDYREDPLQCHEIIDRMEWECLRRYGIHLVIHYDPVITDDPVLTGLKEQTAALLAGVDDRLTLHDFRMVPGKNHTNLVFDVALPADLRGREEDIRQQIEQAMNRPGPMTYHIRITYDIL